MCAYTNDNEISTVCIQELSMYVTILKLVSVTFTIMELLSIHDWRIYIQGTSSIELEVW